MSSLHLLLASYRSRPVGTVLTFLALVAAFVLFRLLYGVSSGFDNLLDWLSADSLRVQSRAGMRQVLPLSYLSRIEAVPGIRLVGYEIFVPASYQSPYQTVSVAAMSAARMFSLPHLILPEEQHRALMERRTGAVAGSMLMKRFGWKLHDRVPLQSSGWRGSEGGNSLYFDIVGVYDQEGNPALATELYVNYEYVDEHRLDTKGTVNMFVVRVDRSSDANRVARTIDTMFANSSDETFTQSDKEWVGAQLRQIGDLHFVVNSILGATFFTLLLLLRNGMAQSIRMRKTDLATMRAIGFTDGRVALLVIAEACLLCIAGGLVGLALAQVFAAQMLKAAGLPNLNVPNHVILVGIVLAVLMGLVTSFLPARSAMRGSLATALRRV